MRRASRLHAHLLLPLLAAAICGAVGGALSGCANELRRPDPLPRRIDTVGHSQNFRLPAFEEGRALDTVIPIDFDRTGKPEYVVASKDTVLSLGRADLVTIYAYDSVSRGYIQRVNHLVTFAKEFATVDVTGDGNPELVVYTWGGGNDLVASSGMVIYSHRNGEITRIYEASHGAPALDELPGVAGRAIMLHALFWPEFMSHGDAQLYLDDVLGYRKGAFASVRREQGMIFRTLAQGHLDSYRTLRTHHQFDTTGQTADTLGAESDSLDSGVIDARPHPLFMPSALAMILLGRANEKASLRSFWSSERSFLEKRIPAAQYEELEKVYGRAMGLIAEG